MGVDDIDQAAWMEWLAYRKAIKKPLKEPSWPLAMRKMASYGAHQRAAVEHSIANGWQGLYLPVELRDKLPAATIRAGDAW